MARRGSGPGKSHRIGVSLVALQELFPDEVAARDWFAGIRWPDGRHCPRCGSTRTSAPDGVLTYWCSDCRRRFSVRTGSVLECSRLPLRMWAIAIYLFVTSLKGVSSMKLHRDLEITQKSAWFMLHRIRKAFEMMGPVLQGPVEVDETYIGGKRASMSKAKRKAIKGRGPFQKTAVAGVMDRPTNQVRARVVDRVDSPTLQGFIVENVKAGSTVFSDNFTSYIGMPFPHEAVNHSVGEYVRGQAHTQGIESFWAMLKRAHKGTYHKMSRKHLQRYVDEFAGRHNVRNEDTLDQMRDVVARFVGKRLMYADLISD